MSVIKNKIFDKVYIAIVFIWVGFLLSISFMESWLKFQAEGVTLKIGVSIGRLVFGMLNKVEILFSIVLVAVYTKNIITKKYITPSLKFIIIPFLVVLFQTLYLLPSLDRRALQIIQNEIPNQNNVHIVYVLLEILKLIILIYIGIKSLNNYGNNR